MTIVFRILMPDQPVVIVLWSFALAGFLSRQFLRKQVEKGEEFENVYPELMRIAFGWICSCTSIRIVGCFHCGDKLEYRRNTAVDICFVRFTQLITSTFKVMFVMMLSRPFSSTLMCSFAVLYRYWVMCYIQRTKRVSLNISD